MKVLGRRFLQGFVPVVGCAGLLLFVACKTTAPQTSAVQGDETGAQAATAPKRVHVFDVSFTGWGGKDYVRLDVGVQQGADGKCHFIMPTADQEKTDPNQVSKPAALKEEYFFYRWPPVHSYWVLLSDHWQNEAYDFVELNDSLFKGDHVRIAAPGSKGVQEGPWLRALNSWANKAVQLDREPIVANEQSGETVQGCVVKNPLTGGHVWRGKISIKTVADAQGACTARAGHLYRGKDYKGSDTCKDPENASTGDKWGLATGLAVTQLGVVPRSAKISWAPIKQ